MYRVLLVDDEYYVREMMKQCVDWNALGFSICAEASNCAGAIETAIAVRPDLIMLDINLPDGSGFGVAQAVQQAGIPCKIVVVTGYDEFEFAKKAIQSHVHDYLLKPVMSAEMTNVLQSVHALLDDEKNQTQRMQMLVANVEDLLSKVDHTKHSEAPESDAQLTTSQLAKKVNQYVEENLCDPDLSVSTISAALYVNLSYLSSLFKKNLRGRAARLRGNTAHGTRL